MKNLLTLFLVSGLYLIQAQGVQDQPFNFNHKSCTFNARISHPTGGGPFPAIMLVPGSGQNDKDGSLTLSGGNSQCLYPGLVDSSLTIYKDLALSLSELGYLVLRYDELFISCPGTSTPVADYNKLWLPAEAALDSLALHPLVDPNKIYLMGHSEGGSLINYLAAKRSDIAALINIAGAYTPFDSLLARQVVDIATLCGGNVSQAQLQSAQILAYYTALRNGTAGLPPFAGATASAWAKYIAVNDSVKEYYEIANLPTLFLGMGDDFNVPTSEWQRFKDSLGNDPKNEFYLLNGLNHYLTPDSLAKVDQRVSDTIHHFLNKLSSLGLPSQKQGFFEFYPNPSMGTLHFSAPEHFYGTRLRIYTTQGQLVAERKLEPQLELKLKPGHYILEVNSLRQRLLIK